MSLVVGFAILTFVFAYLAINTPERHGALQIGHYVLVHVMALFTGYIGFADAASGESVADLMAGFVSSYSFLVYLVGAYFGIFMIVKALKFFSGEE
jgi:hypothetical protein